MERERPGVRLAGRRGRGAGHPVDPGGQRIRVDEPAGTSRSLHDPDPVQWATEVLDGLDGGRAAPHQVRCPPGDAACGGQVGGPPLVDREFGERHGPQRGTGVRHQRRAAGGGRAAPPASADASARAAAPLRDRQRRPGFAPALRAAGEDRGRGHHDHGGGVGQAGYGGQRGRVGRDGRPPLPQGAVGGRELPGPLDRAVRPMSFRPRSDGRISAVRRRGRSRVRPRRWRP